jgi:hypothetical protein
MKLSELTDADFEQSGITSKQFFKITAAYRKAGENAYAQAFTGSDANVATVNIDVKLATLTPTLREHLFEAYAWGWKFAQDWASLSDHVTCVVPVHPIIKPPGLLEDPLALFA